VPGINENAELGNPTLADDLPLDPVDELKSDLVKNGFDTLGAFDAFIASI
jgi:hypothetical protein